jgi:uncharacterized protein YabN with tetrapyrrole methylase and pyrophosphatase domain
MLWNAPTKFIKRFQYLESKAGDGKLMDMTLAEMDVLGRSKKSYN